MRFAYIDSQGKEVSIPGADALRLRIELGAIGDETMFYDGSADRWAPAGEHEIFRALRRELSEREGRGFVVPHPPATPPRQGAPPVRPHPPATPSRSAPPADDRDPRAGAGDLPADAVEGAAPTPELQDPPAAPSPEGRESPPPEPVEPRGAAVTPHDDTAPPPARSQAPEPPAAAPDVPEADGGSDGPGDPGAGQVWELAPNPFAALDGPGPADEPGRQFPTLESAEADTGDPVAADRREDGGVGSPGAPDDPAPPGGGGDWDLGIALTLDDGMNEVDEGAEDTADGPAPDGGDGSGSEAGSQGWGRGDEGGGDVGDGALGLPDAGLELEPTLSDVDSDVVPPWMRADRDPPPDPDAAPAWTRHRDEPEPDDDEFPDREEVRRRLEARRPEASAERAPPPAGPPVPPGPTRSAGPQRRPVPRRAASPGLLAGVGALIVAAVAAGWFGLRALSGGGGDAPVEEAVEIPDIPPGLEPRLRTLAARATERMAQSLAALPARRAIAPEPDPDWLGGRYMANASQYPGIATYWEGVAEWVDAMRAQEADFFASAFADEVRAERLTADDAALILERGRAGFRAAARDRRLVYDQFRQVATAALALHAFLLENEADIDFEPAVGGLSRDPVLEAVPASPELGEEMWNRVGDITDALDALGLLDRVTTERLSEVFFEKLRATPIR